MYSAYAPTINGGYHTIYTINKMEHEFNIDHGRSTPSPSPSEGRQCPGKLKPWLISQIDGRQIQDLIWLDRERGIFKLSWVHKSKENWTEDDAVAQLSMKWAINKGKYREGVDEKCFPKWKQTLRAAFRATNVTEIKEGQGYDCGENYKIYCIGAMDAPAAAQRSPSNSPKSSFRAAAPAAACYQDNPCVIPSVVTDYKSMENQLPSDLGGINSGDLCRMEDQSISLTAAEDPDRYRATEPMDF